MKVLTEDVLDLLIHDRIELAAQIKPPLLKFLEFEEYFPDSYKNIFTQAKNKFILKELRLLIQDRFDLNYVEAQEILDELIGHYAINFFLQKETYEDTSVGR